MGRKKKHDDDEWVLTERRIYEPDPESDEYPDEIDGVPVGCAACGGPYPDCMISCDMFDD